MKKQVLGMTAALFALMLALFAGAYAADTSAAELSAANTAYAILYEDGTLVFQYGYKQPGADGVVATYSVDFSRDYGYPSPWYNAHSSIRVVSFADKISPVSTAYWFYDCSNLKRVDNIQNLDTSKVTNMHTMFQHCVSLTTLDVSHFDTSNVTNMAAMFRGCSDLTTLDVSHFDTSNVTNMAEMFTSCCNLTALDLSYFNTTKVTNMAEMFDGCSGLTALNMSRFDTANVKNMRAMFVDCKGLTVLDVSHFDTANVTEIDWMFDGCSGLTALDVSHFDTANVRAMDYMFAYCSKLTALDLSHFDTANVTDMQRMFSGCSSLKTIYASNKFTTASVSIGNGRNMFAGCAALIGGNGTKFDKSNIDTAYTRIDTPSLFGYFTYKPFAPDVYAIADTVTGRGMLSVMFSNPGTATLAVSYFDANGKFLSAEVQSVQENAGIVAFSLLSGTKKMCVMLLDGDFCLLCEARTETLYKTFV